MEIGWENLITTIKNRHIRNLNLKHGHYLRNLNNNNYNNYNNNSNTNNYEFKLVTSLHTSVYCCHI